MARRHSRKHEHLKPRPSPDRAITLTKKSVATSQLITAISLWFENGDPISIFVLAANAHELFHALGKKVGKPSEFQTWLETMPKSFQARSTYVINFCKHGWKDLEESTLHDPRLADVLIYFAIRGYRAAIGEPTPIMFAFDLRSAVENPEMVSSAAKKAVSKLVDIYNARAISRQQFLNEYLSLIELRPSAKETYLESPPQ
jgi:hypothetical protein